MWTKNDMGAVSNPPTASTSIEGKSAKIRDFKIHD